jgi:PPM family protein phosphatase
VRLEPSNGRDRSRELDVAWDSAMGRMKEDSQDSVLLDARAGLFIVSDGMGGGQAGEMASFMVTHRLPDLIEVNLERSAARTVKDYERAIRDAIVIVNHQIRDEGSQMGAMDSVGATVVMALIHRGVMHLAHVGDSRAYLLRKLGLAKLTRDHTTLNAMLRRGAVSKEEMAYHPMRGKLARFVGMGGDVEPDIRTFRIRPGEKLLLCTDGLTDALRDDQIEAVLEGQADIVDACRNLVHAAEAAGARDNVTAMLVKRLA